MAEDTLQTDAGRVRQAVVEALHARLGQDNDLTRCWAAKALGAVGARETVPSLIARLSQDTDPDVRMEAAAALGRIASSEASEALIDSLHHDPDGDVRVQACLALGKIGDASALDALATCLTEDGPVDTDDWGAGDDIAFDASWEIQHRALELLGELGDAHAVEPIIRLIQDETVADLEELGFRVLAQLGGDRAQAYLLQRLQKGPHQTRRRAAQALKHLSDAEVVQGLIQALRDRQPDVCIAAAWALAEHPNAAAVSPIIRLLRHLHEDVRREAAAVVACLPGDDVGEHLRRLLQDRKRSVQQQAVRLVGERRDGKATEKLLDLIETSQGDGAFRHDIVMALGAIGTPEATIPLCRLYQDDRIDSETRLQIVLALGHTAQQAAAYEATCRAGDKATTDPFDPVTVLVQALSDADEKVSVGALVSLAKIGGARASEACLRALRGEFPKTNHPPGAEGQSLRADTSDPPPAFPTSTLAAMQAPNASPSLDDDLTERRQRLRRHAAKTCRDTADLAMVDALLQTAQEADPELRREALLSLGHLGDSRGIAVAAENLSAASREVQLAAIETLQRLGQSEAIEPLLKLLGESTDPFVTQQTIDALGSLGDQRATEPIMQQLHDADRQVRRAALEALGTLGDRRVIDAIRPLIFADSGELRTEAVAALTRLGDAGLTGALLELLNNPEDEEQHWIAIEALSELYAST